jgi:hypothetical protein
MAHSFQAINNPANVILGISDRQGCLSYDGLDLL